MKNAVSSHVTSRGSCKYRRFGGTHRHHDKGDSNRRARNNVNSNLQLKKAASVASYRRPCSYFTDSCHPCEGGAMLLRNVGSYKSHTA
jgi:hypothetical protein